MTWRQMGFYAGMTTGFCLIGGASSYLYFQRLLKQHDQKQNTSFSLSEIEQPRMTYEEALVRAKQINHFRSQIRKSKLYFNEIDEFFTEEQVIKEQQTLLMESETNMEQQIPLFDDIPYLLEQAEKKYHAVVVNFGNEEHFLAGTTKITKEIFSGTQDKTENAMVFVENLEKIRLNNYRMDQKQARRNRDDVGDADTLTLTTDDNYENKGDSYDSDSPKSEEDSEVILNISPRKYEKPKDQLFIDFFSMYTREFVDEKREFCDDNKKKRSRSKKTIKIQKPKISQTIRKSEWIQQGRPKLESFE